MLLHGNPLDHVSWHKVAARLAKSYHVSGLLDNGLARAEPVSCEPVHIPSAGLFEVAV
jgi:hypothetical protein